MLSQYYYIVAVGVCVPEKVLFLKKGVNVAKDSSIQNGHHDLMRKKWDVLFFPGHLEGMGLQLEVTKYALTGNKAV